MNVLEVKNVVKEYTSKKYFWTKKKKVQIVKDVSLSIKQGQCLGLVGESGCGKTTLGKVIAGLEPPSQGDVLVNGISILSASKKEKFLMRRDMQMVFQDCIGSINPKHSAGSAIIEPVKNYLKLEKHEEQKIIDELIRKVGLNKEDKYKYSSQFSGGQLQRICIARSLSLNPKLIILDEPLSSLDVSVQAQILNLLSDLKKEYSLSYLLISHDMEAIYYLSDSIAVMYFGRIVEYIEDINLFDSLCHPYTEKLLSSVLSSTPGKKKIALEKHEELDIAKANAKGCVYAHRCKKTTELCFGSAPELKEINKKHYIACHHIIEN